MQALIAESISCLVRLTLEAAIWLLRLLLERPMLVLRS
jgi:hypothetical protein